MMIIKQGPYIFYVCNKRYSGSLYVDSPLLLKLMEMLYTEPTSICTVSLVFIWQSFEAYATPMEVILSLSSKRIKGMLDQLHQRQSCIHFLGTENLHIISNFKQRVKQEVYLI